MTSETGKSYFSGAGGSLGVLVNYGDHTELSVGHPLSYPLTCSFVCSSLRPSIRPSFCLSVHPPLHPSNVPHALYV